MVIRVVDVLKSTFEVIKDKSAPLSAKGAQAASGERTNFEDTSRTINMPVVLGKEAPGLHPHGGLSPSGEANGVDLPDALTDVEDLSEGDGNQSPMLKRKVGLAVPAKDSGALTDTEDMDFSGEEEEYIPEKKNLPTIQDLGLLAEPTREVVNLTEGFARQPSPLLSGSESDVDDVTRKHTRNLKRMDTLTNEQLADGALLSAGESEAEGLTDVEDMAASGDEVEEATEVVEDSLPAHYLDQSEGVSNKEKITPVAPTPKIFLHRHDEESSDEEQQHKQKPKRKSKTSLKVEVREDGTTDVEDLVFSDKGGDVVKPSTVPAKEQSVEKPRKKKLIRRRVIKKTTGSASLAPSTGDADALTDVEVLTGDDEEYEVIEDGVPYLGVGEYGDDGLTDNEDIEASDTEDVETLVAKPVEKLEPASLPAPHAEKVKISETEEKAPEENEGDTDEEGFVLDDKDDERPLIPRQKVFHEPLETIERWSLDVEEPCEAVLTDTEDFDMDDKEEEEILKDFASRIPEEGEIYTIKEMESNMGRISKSELIRDADAELKRKIKEAESEGLTLQEALHEETLTDVEDLDEDKNSKKKTKRKQKREDETSEESVTESDIEEEIQKSKPAKKVKAKGRRLPLHPQISEVRFIETEQGPLSIIVTPDTLENNPGKIIKDQVANVVFLESEENEATTDVEDLVSDDEKKDKPTLRTPKSSNEPTTDTEDLDIDPADLERPVSPLPPNTQRDVFSSPKRELISIKEDKYGVPQVTIRKLGKDELMPSDVEDAGVTDTEDIEVSEGEALRIVGVTEDETSDFQLPDTGKVEVTSKMMNKSGLKVAQEEDEGHTDVEELHMGNKKQRRKPKSHNKLAPALQEDSHTDVELLSDQEDKSNLKVRMESPGAHTDLEDFETSEAEELEIPKHENAPTPDIIRKAAIKRVVILKEGPDGGVTQTEESEVAPPRKSLLGVEDEQEGITDTEDMEASGAEDEGPEPEYPPVDLSNIEPSNVSMSEKSSLPKSRNEAKHIKDNLLLPEDNYNNLTDVESLSEGEGNRCASNTGLLSSQPLTHAVESGTVEELPYYVLPTDPKLCEHPGVSLESDPYCGELTSPLVVEAELEQVYYHAPMEDAHESEMELEASNGCVVRKRQVVASLCQAREIRRFWSLDRNSPLNQSEVNAFATPTIHKKGFKTILYLEQPNLLDTISISDTLCDSGYFRNERLLDFDSSSIDSLDDHFSYRDSDIVTVVDQFNQDRGSSFDDLPSPHLSSIGSTGIVDSFCSAKSFSSDPQSPLILSSYSKCSSEDLRKESELTLSLSGISALSFSPDSSLHQEVELSMFDVGTNDNHNDDQSVCSFDRVDAIPSVQQTSPYSDCTSPTNVSIHYKSTCSLNRINIEKFDTENSGITSTDEVSPVLGHRISDTIKGPAVECHEGFTTECIREYASKHNSVSALECTEREILDNRSGFTSEHIKGFATECIEVPQIESVEELIPDYEVIDAASCVKTSPTGYIQRSITEWIVRQSSGAHEDLVKQPPSVIEKSPKSSNPVSAVQCATNTLNSKSLDEHPSEFVSPSSPLWLKSSVKYHPSKHVQLASEIKSSNIENKPPTFSVSNTDTESSDLLQLSKHSEVLFEDSGVHDYQMSGSFTSSLDKRDKVNQVGDESDHVSLADSVLGLEDQLERELLQDLDSSVTYISAQFSPISQALGLFSSQTQEENSSKTEIKGDIKSPISVVPLIEHHTPSELGSQPKCEDKAPPPKMSENITKDFEEISKDFGGVKELIDQWEVIVREEHLRSLPASPAVGRKILPPSFDGNESKKTSVGSMEGEIRGVTEGDFSKRSVQTHVPCNKTEDVSSAFEGGVSVIEEVASVCDIIQQFEGRVGRLGKVNAHRQRLPRGSQSPASRSPSHHRRVATVKPLCEPQLQQERSLLLQEGQQQLQQQEQLQELLEQNTVSAGFVPRVVESLSITKCSNEIWDENPPHASVSNPEGTHEAAQIADQQPTSLSHDQGLDVEEMSNIMESYTSDGSDHITTTTTTHTTTSIDPDPITSTQITRITRRTEIEDGEVKEDVYEEY